jgi:hypothetical protein
MSRCDEYREQMLAVEREIRRVKEWPSVREDDRDRRSRIEALERQKEVLKSKWEGSMRRGGC